MLLIGGDDFTVRMWKVNEQVHQTPSEALKSRSVAAEKVKKEIQLDSSTSCSKGKKKMTGKLKSLLPVSATLDGRGRISNLNDIRSLANHQGIPLDHSSSDQELAPITSESLSPHLGLFCDQQSSRQTLQEEINHHLNGSNFDLAIQLQMWQGDVESAIRDAVKKRQLTDFLIGQAPQVSQE